MEDQNLRDNPTHEKGTIPLICEIKNNYSRFQLKKKEGLFSNYFSPFQVPTRLQIKPLIKSLFQFPTPRITL